MANRDFETAWNDFIFDYQGDKEAALRRVAELAITHNQWLRIQMAAKTMDDIRRRAEEQLRRLSSRRISPAVLAQFEK